jgi:hypothetical protein
LHLAADRIAGSLCESMDNANHLRRQRYEDGHPGPISPNRRSFCFLENIHF